MVNKNLLLDTNIVLNILNGDEFLAEFVFTRNCSISFITYVELFGFKNLHESEKLAIFYLLENVEIIHSTTEIMRLSAKNRIDHSLKTADAVILATSQSIEAQLITSDKHFFNLKDEEIIKYEYKEY